MTGVLVRRLGLNAKALAGGMLPATCAVFALLGLTVALVAQEHQHSHGAHGQHGDQPVERPRVFLDKSPRIVAYQLKRLDNERLLLVERKTDDPKYAPVYSAILTRAGMSPQYREESLAALVQLNQSNPATVVFGALAEMDTEDDAQQLRTGQQLVKMLLSSTSEALRASRELLVTAAGGDTQLVRSAAHAALMVAGEAETSWQLVGDGEQARLDWVGGVPLIPQARLRAAARPRLVELLAATQPVAVRRAAAGALSSTPNDASDTFMRLSALLSEAPAVDAGLRAAAVKTMLSIPAAQRENEAAQRLLEHLVKHAESTPAAERTTDEFVDEMQLADQLLARTPADVAKPLRDRLREITVRVVRIQTVEEEMRYDTPYFAVEAGRPVQIVLRNEDLMPHNLVVTVPGALQEVAQLGLETGPMGHDGKAYVPDSDKVLFATNLVPSLEQARLTFDAPSAPGEYPFVCTFPRHWMRMYGVMVVVEDLDAWNRNPVAPKDPVGSNRPFVKNWTLDDLRDELADGLRGRSREIGERLFKEASCAQCHKIHGQGGAVGPELTEVFKRWKGDRAAVLREMLEPSYRIDDKYAVHLIRTEDGETISGIILAETDKEISILDNPESKQPRVIPATEIDRKLKTSTSMMPKALLDRFSKDEIFEILAYLESAAAGK
ncbi:MAG: c-type cytochrome [Planctomycetales bacterium]|nr:c-type cytochrome [Planctomycetales bacterium]